MMNFFSSKVEKLKAPVTVPINISKPSERKHNAIYLNCGEADFDTPENIKQAAYKAIREGQTKYTAVDGVYELKEAICHKFSRDNNLIYKPEQVIVSMGAQHVIYNAMVASLNPGDEVIIISPYWVYYPEMIALASGTPVIVPTLEEDGFKARIEHIERAITPKTKWLLLNSPANPTGIIYSYADLKAIGELLLRYERIHILCDDLYEYLTYNPEDFVTLPQVEPRLYDRTLLVNGFSKSYSMTGWRVGYGVGPTALINNMVKVQLHCTSSPSSISQYAAIEAIMGDQSYLDCAREEFQKRRDLVVQMLNDIPFLRCLCPHGGFYVYVYCGNFLGKQAPSKVLIETDRDFVDYLSNHYEVKLISGTNFGMSPYFRLSFVASCEILTEACERIKMACLSLR